MEYRTCVKRLRFRKWRWTVDWETEEFIGSGKGIATSQLVAQAECDAYLADVQADNT